jgi:hypothetical protein
MQSANTVRMRTRTRARRRTQAHTQDLGVAVVGVALLGVGVAHNELHVGYAVRSVVAQLSYTARLVQSESPTLSNAIEWTVTLSTFHAPMFALNANAW